MFGKVLYPVESQSLTEGSLPLLAVLALRLHCPVVVMGVTEAAPGGGADLTVASRLQNAGLEVMTDSTAATVESIQRAALEHSCDLIALPVAPAAAQGKASLSPLVAGTLRSSAFPVILIPATAAAPPEELVVCLDGSALAETSLPYAEALARALGAKMTLARAPRPVAAYGPSLGGYPGAVELADAADAEVEAHLSTVARRLEAGGMEVRWRTISGTPAAGIIDYAAQSPHAMVVMTSHGRSGFSRWLLGSVTEEVAESGRLPVLVIPQGVGEQRARYVTDLLAGAPVFSALTEGQRRDLARLVRIAEYRRGEMVFREAEPARGCYVVVEGEVELGRQFGTPEETVISRVGPGQLFGEASVLGEAPNAYSARAADDIRCISILREDLREQIEKHPEIAADLLPALVERLRDAVQVAASR
jgi:nucleotide-binding universal stress UspA family protein